MIKDDCKNCNNFALYPYSTKCLECGKSPKNRMGEGLYIHYLCNHTIMMMLTPLEGQIAAPNHNFVLNGVFF